MYPERKTCASAAKFPYNKLKFNCVIVWGQPPRQLHKEFFCKICQKVFQGSVSVCLLPSPGSWPDCSLKCGSLEQCSLPKSIWFTLYWADVSVWVSRLLMSSLWRETRMWWERALTVTKGTDARKRWTTNVHFIIFMLYYSPLPDCCISVCFRS